MLELAVRRQELRHRKDTPLDHVVCKLGDAAHLPANSLARSGSVTAQTPPARTRIARETARFATGVQKPRMSMGGGPLPGNEAGGPTGRNDTDGQQVLKDCDPVARFYPWCMCYPAVCFGWDVSGTRVTKRAPISTSITNKPPEKWYYQEVADAADP